MSQTKLSELSENEEMIVPVNAIYAIAWRSLKKIQQVKFMKKFDVWLSVVPVNAIYAIAWRSLKKIQQVKFMKKFDVWLS